jgi:hypothetical protein
MQRPHYGTAVYNRRHASSKASCWYEADSIQKDTDTQNQIVPSNCTHPMAPRSSNLAKIATASEAADNDATSSMVIITQLHPHDVLLGRGSPHAYYAGNISFRELVDTRKTEYNGTGRHDRKQAIALEIYQEVQNGRHGRFLTLVTDINVARRHGVPDGTKAWTLAKPAVAMEKIKQALREKPSDSAVSTLPVVVASSVDSAKVAVKSNGATPLTTTTVPKVATTDSGSDMNHSHSMASCTNPVNNALVAAALLRQQNAALWQQNATLLTQQQQQHSDQQQHQQQLLFGASSQSSFPHWPTSMYTIPTASAAVATPRLSLGGGNVWTVNVPMLLPTSAGAPPQPVLVHCGVTSASFTPPPAAQPPSLLDSSSSSSLLWSTSALNAAIQARAAATNACSNTIPRLEPALFGSGGGGGTATSVRFPPMGETESTMAALLRYQQTMAAAAAVLGDVNGPSSPKPSAAAPLS